ncbi:MAG: HAD family hydrolase [Hyphomicrobiales bacterium]
MNIAGILFDKDGTLIDFEATWQPVYHTVAHHVADGDAARADALLALAGFDPVAKRCKAGSVLAAGTADDLAALWRPDLGGEALVSMVDRLNDMFTAGAIEHLAPLTDLGALFDSLKVDGRRLGIATNDVTRSADACFEHLGLTAMLDFVTGYDGVPQAKPAPDMVYAFCAACGLEPGEVAVVGDNVHDLEMGLAAGAGLRVGVLSGNCDAQDFGALADILLDTVTGLPAALERHAATGAANRP